MFTVVFGPILLAGLTPVFWGTVSSGLLMPAGAAAVFLALFIAGSRIPV